MTGNVMLFALMLSHFVCDYPLQSEFIARNKSRHAGPPKAYDPALHGPLQTVWPWVLTSHAATHAAGVFFVTGSAGAAIAELVVHWLIDFGKCERKYGIHADQFFHLATKVFIWIAIGAAK